jgi:hypothetical protein
MADDWRLMGQERFLMGRKLKWAAWCSSGPGWDHDHCTTCQAEISDQPISEHVSYNSAWVTADDNYTWICPRCLIDFIAHFQWRINADYRAAQIRRSSPDDVAGWLEWHRSEIVRRATSGKDARRVVLELESLSRSD